MKQIKENLGWSVNPKIFGAFAQLALVVVIASQTFNLPIHDYFLGMLLGLSLVGNINLLLTIRENREA